MYYPAIKLHQLYSLNICDGLDVIFEDLKMVNMYELNEVIKTKDYNKVEIVLNIFSIDTVKKTMTIVGHKINDGTYIINKAGNGDIMFVSYNCEKETVVKGIEYLYHMTNNLIKRT